MNDEYDTSPQAAESGLMHPQLRNGEPCFTDAGLFAIAGMLAYDADPDQEEMRQHCLIRFARAMDAARNGGMPDNELHVIARAFEHHINPADGSDEGKTLALLCQKAALAIGLGRMLDIIEDRTTH
jgi:hypothetical protein